MRSVFFSLSFSVLSLSWAGHYQTIHSHRNFENAVTVGMDIDGNTLFLCQANLFHGVQPGKTWPGARYCLIPYGGREYAVENFIVPEQDFFNTQAHAHTHTAIVVGHEANGKSLLLCQAIYRGSHQPGKTWPGYRYCNISYEGREIRVSNYRILKPSVLEDHPRAITTQHSHSQTRETHHHSR